MKPVLLAAAATAGIAALACSGSGDDPGDGADDRFGDAADEALAQGPLVRATLAMLNEPTLAFEELDDEAGLKRNAVEAIFVHRDGPDGKPGGGDDDLFDTPEELDAVPFIGAKALARLLDHTARTRKPAPIAGLVIDTFVTGLEVEDGDFCVFIALTESGERIGFTDTDGDDDCFAGVFSEHPEDELAPIRTEDLEFLTDPAEIDALRELEPAAFYVRLVGAVDNEHQRTIGCVSTSDPQLISRLDLILAGDTFRLARGFIELGFDHPINEPEPPLEEGTVDPVRGELAMVVDTVEHGDGTSKFELHGDKLKMAFDLAETGSTVTAKRGSDEFESALDCEL